MKFEFIEFKPSNMATLSSIESFLAPKQLAVIGVSRNPKKFGRVVFESLKEKGFSVYPVNPHTDNLNGEPCYKDINSLPDEVDRVYIVTPPEKTAESVRGVLNKGIKNIWIQQNSESSEALEMIRDTDVNLIHNQCILMYANPVKGAHRLHRFFNKLFGKYPK
jgi:predicted CoA-binding protein